MKSNIVWTLFYTIRNVLGILFFYGLSVNVSMFYEGVTSAWVTLFTFMTMSGALLLTLLIDLLVVEKKDSNMFQCSTMVITSLILSVLGFLSNIYVGGMLLACNLLDCFLKYKKKNTLYSIVMFVGVIVICNYSFRASWISLSKYLFLIMIEMLLVFQYRTDRKVSYIDTRTVFLNKKELLLQTCIQLMKYLCILGTFACGCVSMIHIYNEGELFSMKKMDLYLLMICLGMLLISYVEKKKIKEKNEVSQRFAFILTMIVVGCVMLKSSIMLSLVWILICGSYVALEILLMMYDKQLKKNLFMNVMLCVILVVAQTLYDGIYVDYSVVLMNVFLMLGVVGIIHLFSDLKIEDTIEEEVEEYGN
jgi:hypothetical protein